MSYSWEAMECIADVGRKSFSFACPYPTLQHISAGLTCFHADHDGEENLWDPCPEAMEPGKRQQDHFGFKISHADLFVKAKAPRNARKRQVLPCFLYGIRGKVGPVSFYHHSFHKAHAKISPANLSKTNLRFPSDPVETFGSL